MWRGWFWIGDGGWRGFNLRNAGRATPAVSIPLPSESSSPSNGTSSAIGRGIVGFFMSSALAGGKMSPVNGGAINDTTPTNATLSSDDYPNGLFFGSNPFSNLTRFQSINNVIIDTLEGQLLTALIVVSFILIFLIREWVVQQQPALIGGAVMPMDFEVEENQQPVAEADDLPLEPILAGQDVAGGDQLEHDFGLPQGDEQEDNGEPTRTTRPIARVRRRRAFPPNESAPTEPEETSGGGRDFFGSQPSQGFVLGGRALDYSHEASPVGSSSHPTRPQVNREMMARAAEVRRAMEEGSRSLVDVATSSTSYDFGQSAERTFQFGASSSGDIYTPESGSSSGSRTPAKGRADKFLGDVSSLGYLGNSEDMDMIDMGNLDWRSRGSDSSGAQAESDSGARVHGFPGNSYGKGAGIAPITGISFPARSEEDKITSRGPVDEEHYDWRVQRATDSSLSENARGKLPQTVVPERWEDEVDEEGDNIGREKEVYTPENMEGLKYDLEGSDNPPSYDDYSTGYLGEDMDMDMDMEEDVGIEQPLLRGFQTSGLLPVSASEVDNSDSSTQPSTPTTSDSQAAPPATDPVPIEQTPEVMHDAIRQIDERRDLLRQLEVRREQQIARDLAAAIEAQPVARGRGAGLWNWFMGDQGVPPALPPPNVADAPDDLDTDDEDDADNFPVAGDGAIPPDVQQAIADEDAADDFDGIMELIGMRGPIAGLVQNAAISSVLITATVALGVAFPYVTGKIVMIILVGWFVYLDYEMLLICWP